MFRRNLSILGNVLSSSLVSAATSSLTYTYTPVRCFTTFATSLEYFQRFQRQTWVRPFARPRISLGCVQGYIRGITYACLACMLHEIVTFRRHSGRVCRVRSLRRVFKLDSMRARRWLASRGPFNGISVLFLEKRNIKFQHGGELAYPRRRYS